MNGANQMPRLAGTPILPVLAGGIPPGGDVRLSLCTSILEMEL
jgi:hypothetical protein